MLKFRIDELLNFCLYDITPVLVSRFLPLLSMLLVVCGDG